MDQTRAAFKNVDGKSEERKGTKGNEKEKLGPIIFCPALVTSLVKGLQGYLIHHAAEHSLSATFIDFSANH